MSDAKDYIRLTMAGQIRNLTHQFEVNTAEMESIIRDMENAGDRISEAREVIEANQRLIADLIENSINFGNNRIDNLADTNEEITELIEGLKVELAKLSPEPDKVERAPKVTRTSRTMYGKVTDDQMEKTFKKYQFLLVMPNEQRLEHIALMRQKGYPEHDTTISKSLGKCAGWFGNLVHQARAIGLDVPDKF